MADFAIICHCVWGARNHQYAVWRQAEQFSLPIYDKSRLLT